MDDETFVFKYKKGALGPLAGGAAVETLGLLAGERHGQRAEPGT